jgi:hypothetical protein
MKKSSRVALRLLRARLRQTAEELIAGTARTRERDHVRHGLRPEAVQPAPQINKSNVKRLVPSGHQPRQRHGRALAATIYNGVMYVVNGNWTFALDVATGRQTLAHAGQYDRGRCASRAAAPYAGPQRSTTASSSARRWTRT